MRSTYEQSKLKLDSLKRYVDNLDTLNWVILQYSQGMFDGKPTLDINLTEKKVYDYSLAIIQLYGIFENFLECIVCAYLSALSKQITLYQNLPETVREHNLSLSAKLLGNNFSKYDSVTPEELVRNLHSCFDVASDSYCLNITAFRQHASNFREDSMREFLHNAGICNVDKMISTNEKLKAFLGITSGESVPLSKYFEYLKDLVQRRNIVAHGEMEDNILEIRFDSIRHDPTVSIGMNGIIVTECIKWLKDVLGISLFTCEHTKLISTIKDNPDGSVCIYKQMMELSSGGSAELTASEQTDYVLPFIGELRELISENEPIFDQSEEIKRLLLQYLEDKETTAHYPYVYIKWVRPIDSESYIVKIIFDYFQQKYTLMQHISGNCKDFGKERMNNAIKYLCESSSFTKGEKL